MIKQIVVMGILLIALSGVGDAVQTIYCGAPGHHDTYSMSASFAVSNASLTEYAISGNADCVDFVKLKILDGGSYTEIAEDTTSGRYSFDVLDNYTYQVVFYPDLHSYQFTVTGDNIEYNYDACIHTTYNLKESCGNLILDILIGILLIILLIQIIININRG